MAVGIASVALVGWGGCAGTADEERDTLTTGPVGGSAFDGGAGRGASHARGGAGGGASFADAGGAGQVLFEVADADQACESHAECLLVQTTCCLDCGANGADAYAAVRADMLGKYHGIIDASPSCSGCLLCISELDPLVFASCQSGRCTVVDIAALPRVTGCDAHDDCHLRLPGCCECEGDPTSALAVSDAAAFEGLFCDPGQADACPACQPSFPTGMRPICDGGVCSIIR